MAELVNAQSTKIDETITFNTVAKVINLCFGPDSVDCSFKFEDKEIGAHRKLLAGFSSVFATMFNASWSNSDPIPIVDATYENFATFLDYFYKGEIQLNERNAMEILYLAHKYDIEELVSSCSSFACGQISLANVVEYFGVSIRLNQQQLQLKCTEFITKKTKSVMESEEFLQCDLEVLNGILQIDKLSCEESMVFSACIEWAKDKCRKNNLDDSQPTNLRAELGDCFNLIRFKEMKSEEFTKIYDSFGEMFSKGETGDFLFHFIKQKDCLAVTRYIELNKPIVRPVEFVFNFDRDSHTSTDLKAELSFSMDEPLMLSGVAFYVPCLSDGYYSMSLRSTLLIEQDGSEIYKNARLLMVTANGATGRFTMSKFIAKNKKTAIKINLELHSILFPSHPVTLQTYKVMSSTHRSVKLTIPANTRPSFISGLTFKSCTEENLIEHFGKCPL